MAMDSDIVTRVTRSGMREKQLIVFPDADVSEPDNESDDDVSVQGDENNEESDWSTSDDEPLSALTTQQAQPATRSFRWLKRKPLVADVSWKGSLGQPPDDVLLPIDYFQNYFCDDLLNLIVEQTNMYAAQNGSSFSVDKQELKVFLGLLLKMGICPMPRYRMYWSNELRFGPVADFMSRNRFLDILKFLHFVDNTTVVTDRDHADYDRLAKVRPLLEYTQQACLKTAPEEKQCVDEQMIPFKGRTVLRQYLPKKPKKWGIKVIARCGVSGFTHDFFIYDGTCPPVAESVGYQPADYVMKLCKTLPRDMNFKVYFDKFFNFLELQLKLKELGILSVGTIRNNRARKCILKSEKELKAEGRGSYDYAIDGNSGLSIIRWYDNRAVMLSSTHVSINPVTSVKRWDRTKKRSVDVTCPAIVHEYNTHMGGVDLFDMLMALYRVNHKSKKWYHRVFLWVLNLAVVNSWLLYRRHCEQTLTPAKEQLDLLSFAAKIANSLVLKDQLPPALSRRRGRPSTASETPEEEGPEVSRRRTNQKSVDEDIRFDDIGHLPSFADDRQRCKVCSKGITQMTCVKCSVHLCLQKERNCFIAYHRK